MAGAGLLTEGFQEGQVGSSSMPHKVNARNCERICGFSTILSGYVTMTGALAGHQWNEGDVSCSVVRRVALPDSFFAVDGLLETQITVLRQMEVFPAAIAAENERNLPFLSTTTILMEAVKHGAGRETAHEAIKEHALAAAKAMRSGGDADLLSRLAGMCVSSAPHPIKWTHFSPKFSRSRRSTKRPPTTSPLDCCSKRSLGPISKIRRGSNRPGRSKTMPNSQSDNSPRSLRTLILEMAVETTDFTDEHG
jgi:hypothetical protein